MDDAFEAATQADTVSSVTVSARGRLDAKTAPRLLEHCLAARHPKAELVLRLTEITFLSSSGVGMLLVLSDRCKADGGSLRIEAPSVAVRAPLELLNLHRFLNLDGGESATGTGR